MAAILQFAHRGLGAGGSLFGHHSLCFGFRAFFRSAKRVYFAHGSRPSSSATSNASEHLEMPACKKIQIQRQKASGVKWHADMEPRSLNSDYYHSRTNMPSLKILSLKTLTLKHLKPASLTGTTPTPSPRNPSKSPRTYARKQYPGNHGEI